MSLTAALAPITYHDVMGDDGTMLRAWTNDPDHRTDGPTVLLCNGLGTSPWAWPALLDPDCDVRVVSWNHRGTGGSARPVDPNAVTVDHFAADALSVLDHFGIDRCVVMGWSMGVNTMFELALAHPERVAGLFAVAGVPGDTFRAMLAPLYLPGPVAKTAMVGCTRVLRIVGRVATPLAQRVPLTTTLVRLASKTHLIGPIPDPDLALVAAREFLSTPMDWYAHVALRTAQHPRISLRRVRVPVEFVAGTWDLLAGARQMAAAAARIPNASYVELHGSHLICMEQPERVHQLLVDFIARVGQNASAV
ncbi:MAG: alpha/beta fold hydrolase [Nocardioides sp.]